MTENFESRNSGAEGKSSQLPRRRSASRKAGASLH